MPVLSARGHLVTDECQGHDMVKSKKIANGKKSTMKIIVVLAS
jgi:hypothetical protein